MKNINPPSKVKRYFFFFGIFFVSLAFLKILYTTDSSEERFNQPMASSKGSSGPSVSSSNPAGQNQPKSSSSSNKINTNRVPASVGDEDDFPEPDAETLKLLTHLGIDYKKDAVKTGDHIFYVSDKYSLVSQADFQETQGQIISKIDQFFIMEPAEGHIKDQFPPLVVSYHTGNILTLTGDISIQYKDDVGITQNYLISNFQEDKINDHPKLRSINHLSLVLSRKNEVLSTFQKIYEQIGRNNIVHVELGIKRFHKVI